MVILCFTIKFITIEDEFAITFSDDVVDKLETVQDIIDYVYDKLNQ